MVLSADDQRALTAGVIEILTAWEQGAAGRRTGDPGFTWQQLGLYPDLLAALGTGGIVQDSRGIVIGMPAPAAAAGGPGPRWAP